MTPYVFIGCESLDCSALGVNMAGPPGEAHCGQLEEGR